MNLKSKTSSTQSPQNGMQIEIQFFGNFEKPQSHVGVQEFFSFLSFLKFPSFFLFFLKFSSFVSHLTHLHGKAFFTPLKKPYQQKFQNHFLGVGHNCGTMNTVTKYISPIRFCATAILQYQNDWQYHLVHVA